MKLCHNSDKRRRREVRRWSAFLDKRRTGLGILQDLEGKNKDKDRARGYNSKTVDVPFLRK